MNHTKAVRLDAAYPSARRKALKIGGGVYSGPAGGCGFRQLSGTFPSHFELVLWVEKADFVLVSTIATIFTRMALPVLVVVSAQAAAPPQLPPAAAITVDFARDIEPIFASRCYECHSEKKSKSGFRLDTKAWALLGGDSGAPLFIPGQSSKSQIILRVAGLVKPDEIMPATGERLTAQQIGLLEAWIDQGASWPETGKKTHWAYVKPVRPELPKVKHSRWLRNPIDAFILARLEAEKLKPSAEADRVTLIRRVSLDLTGLPPSIAEVDAFVADKSKDAYEKLVDRLLASPHYGEKWARLWLDLARYADSQGYEKDPPRSMWPYRDWVIDAFNHNMRFDQFTVEQIAGDMLPKATREQKIASGFNRNTMINTEGGVDQEQSRVETIVDRVNTTATVWLGSTLGCAQCHTHKYDPFTLKEYYQFFAFFNNADEPGLDLPSTAQTARKKQLPIDIAALETDLKKPTPELAAAQAAWEKKTTNALALSLLPVTGTNKPPPAPDVPTNILQTLKVTLTARTAQQSNEVSDYFRSHAPELKTIRDQLAELRKAQEDLNKEIPTTLVMQERAAPRETHVLPRGNFLSPAEKVFPGVPAVLPPLPAGEPTNRVTLARWLVSPENPLTARVTVNRFWEQIFGRGLVETLEDFGTQGERPTHPELLDWLATEFTQTNWDMKAMLRLMVTSATYRQSSRSTPELIERDPYNRLYARGPRFRVPAETVRDIALQASGLLSPKIGGPSVYPYQPDGIWTQIYSADKWVTSKGEDKYRRGIYTFWRRTSMYPSFMSFDAPSRELICPRRQRSDTPLQALTTLNDPSFVEAAQGLARRVLQKSKGNDRADATFAFRLCMARAPRSQETKRLVALYKQELAQFKLDPSAAKKIGGDLGKPPEGVSAEKLAAWTVVANVLLNLDETITKG
jgi:mono/diheme cytochrome c family protein